MDKELVISDMVMLRVARIISMVFTPFSIPFLSFLVLFLGYHLLLRVHLAPIFAWILLAAQEEKMRSRISKWKLLPLCVQETEAFFLAAAVC